MSYKLLEAGRIQCSGLPSHVTLKRPSAYGRKDLQVIIAAEPVLQFAGKITPVVFVIVAYVIVVSEKSGQSCRKY